MSDIGLNLDPLVYGAAIALAVALVGTPLAWRAGRGLARVPRALLASLGGLGAAGLLSLPVSLSAYRLEETTLVAVLAAAALQGVALIILLLVPMKG